MVWDIIETAPCSAEENMRFDAELLEGLAGKERPILHLYEWKRPSVTFGHFVRPEELLDLEEAKRRGIDWARRPTGGGVVFHLWDLAFSVLVPQKSSLFSTRSLDNYQWVNQAVKEVIEEILGEKGIGLTPEDGAVTDARCSHFCMARPTKYDVVLEGRKMAGAAQRKTRDGFLHQGTIALKRPDEPLLAAVLPLEGVREAMFKNTFPLVPEGDLEAERKQICERLKKKFYAISDFTKT